MSGEESLVLPLALASRVALGSLPSGLIPAAKSSAGGLEAEPTTEGLDLAPSAPGLQTEQTFSL